MTLVLLLLLAVAVVLKVELMLRQLLLQGKKPCITYKLFSQIQVLLLQQCAICSSIHRASTVVLVSTE
jgi:hypothetical protein